MRFRLERLVTPSLSRAVVGVYKRAAHTVKAGYTGSKNFVWAGQKKIRYKENSGI
jgi:hypothetical protein